MTRDQLVKTYSDYSDEQLIEVYHNLDEYSNEAKEAFADVMRSRGGVDHLVEKDQSQKFVLAETERIKMEVRRLSTSEVDLGFLTKMIKSDIINESLTRTIIQQTFEEINQDLEDRKIKPKTIIGGSVGAGIAGITGGILWGLQMMWSGRIFVIFFIGLILLSYGIIRIVTKQSYKNTGVFVLTAISVVIALIIGQLLFEIFGRT